MCGRGAGRGVVVGSAVDSVHVHRRASLDEHAAVEPGHPPLVLVFDVTVRAVSHDDYCEFVVAGPDMSRHVVFARETVVGAVADELAVHIDEVHAVGGANVQHDLSRAPRRGHVERAAINTGRIVLRQVRGRGVEGHIDVGVVRMIADVLHRPVAGHRDRSPRTPERR